MLKPAIKRAGAVVLLGLGVWGWWYCSSPTIVVVGGGNESPNAFIKGTTACKAGALPDLADVRVSLYDIKIELDPFNPLIYNSTLIGATNTDSQGNFVFYADTTTRSIHTYSLVLEKGDAYKAFSGYRDRAGEEDSVIYDTLLLVKPKRLQGKFINKSASELLHIKGNDTTLVKLYTSIGLLGSHYACIVRPDSSFTLPYVPEYNYKIQIIQMGNTKDGIIYAYPRYTTLIADTANVVYYKTDPYMELQDTIDISSGMVTIKSKHYEMQYTIVDN
jgi:hypothetical protein